ncbi:MAG: EamA family transporter RarD [Chloroflexota bacterium]|nr:EamA family transporter RarD [Chloroflexota bacterium]
MNKGIVYAAGAYVCWGLLPLFWKALQHVPALEILAHRMVWSLLLVLLVLTYQRHWRWFKNLFQQPRIVLTFLASALLLSLNWFIYIWAVNAGFVVDASLGYFINPFVNVVLGVLFLKERLRFWQGIALLVAACGVLYLTVSYNAVPWIALTLAVSFGLYGLLRKTAALNSLEGLSLETLLLFLPALGYLVVQEWAGRGAFGDVAWPTNLLLIFSGAATAVPLLLFAAGARRISLTSLGILQYIAPSLQFGLGVLVFHEALTMARMIGFGLIWLALLLYTLEGVALGRSGARMASATGKT